MAEDALHEVIAALQEQMVTTECWYAHFFCGSLLIVVFRDAVFKVSIDPASWEAVLAHGQFRGIPKRELDFLPHTREAACKEFELPQ